MQIHGFTINGDPEGLQYLLANAAALQQLMDEIKCNGQATFFYSDHHYIVVPTPTGGYLVTMGHRRRGGGLSSRLSKLL